MQGFKPGDRVAVVADTFGSGFKGCTGTVTQIGTPGDGPYVFVKVDIRTGLGRLFAFDASELALAEEGKAA